MSRTGVIGVVTTPGNPDCHVVLRGGKDGPNFAPADVATALDWAGKAGIARRVVIDASHGNSGKDHLMQPAVAAAIAGQVAAGEGGIAGVMLEGFLVAGRQQPSGDPARLVRGQSVTDGCMDWATTCEVLEVLAASVRERRRWLGASR
jgi:3-deoxy-7-phosphoheptulonate synthase